MGEIKTVAPSNKLAVIHVLAALIHDPLLFSDDNYSFSVEDFPEQFHKILFSAVEYLAKNGMEKIDPIDIDQFLKQYAVQYKVFCSNRGIEYIQNALAMFDEKKFDYYYQTFKKYSLLSSLNAQGIDTTDIYDPNIIDPVASAKMYKAFDDLSVNDILLAEETKVILAKETYGSSSDREENLAGDGLRVLKERLKKAPDFGLPLFSPKLTTIYRGQRRGCLYIESAPTGVGKTRRGNAEACHLAVPEYYDVQLKKWQRTELSEKVLVISTELVLDECQRMWMAFVSGVPEDRIRSGKYAEGEEERVDKAVGLIEKAPFYFVSITNYDIDDIVNIIKKYKQLHDVNYVFFDYLGESEKIISTTVRHTKIQGLRTDQILLMFSTALKDLAKTLDIFIWTSSQLSGDFKNAKELDAAYLRSAKSIADKADVGSILMPVRELDQPAIDSYCAKGFELVPNFVISVYKIRSGSYQNIKVFVYFDRGTCQIFDCFVTDTHGIILPVEDTLVKICTKNEEKCAVNAPEYAVTPLKTEENSLAKEEKSVSEEKEKDNIEINF